MNLFRRRKLKARRRGGDDSLEDEVIDAIEDLGEMVHEVKRSQNSTQEDLRTTQKDISTLKGDVKRILKATLEREPPLDSVLVDQGHSAKTNRERIQDNRDALGATREELNGLDDRVDDLERWRERIDTHHGYTQDSINRTRDKGEGLRDQLHTGEIKRTEINVRLLILIGILAAVGSALLGVGISKLLN